MPTQKLPCRLSQLDLIKVGKELAFYARELARLREEKREASAGFNAAIKDAQEEICRYAEQLDTGKVDREVEVEWRYDWHGGRKVLYRLDTQEMIDDQPLSAEERQGHLFSLGELKVVNTAG